SQHYPSSVREPTARPAQIGGAAMKHAMLFIAAMTLATSAYGACANGVYPAGCTGPNDNAAVVNKSTGAVHTGSAHCANGVCRAGCVGPSDNAAVVNKP